MLLDLSTMAIAALRANLLRSCLTMLGVIIGVSSIVAVISVMDALSRSVMQQFEGFGPNTLLVEPYTTFSAALQGRLSSLSHEDTLAIRSRVDGISTITPLYIISGDNGLIRNGSRNAYTTVKATTESYATLYSHYVAEGRFITRYDNQRARPVGVLGASVVENLELEDPVGEYIKLGEHSLKVVGIMEEKGTLFGLDQDDFMIIPYETGRRFLGQFESPQFTIGFSVDQSRDIGQVIDEVTRVLRRSRGLQEGEPADFRVRTSEQVRGAFNQVASVITGTLVGVVTISLLVGGVGIMNIMLVSVTERTREIGIIKALGARRKHIMIQFLLEATMISLLGGVIGLVLGYGVALGFGALVNLEVVLPIWAAVLAFGFSALVGVLFGVLPAAQAGNLNTIDALRFE